MSESWILVIAEGNDNITIERVCVKEEDLKKFFEYNKRKKIYQGMSWDHLKETDCCEWIYDPKTNDLIDNRDECDDEDLSKAKVFDDFERWNMD